MEPKSLWHRPNNRLLVCSLVYNMLFLLSHFVTASSLTGLLTCNFLLNDAQSHVRSFKNRNTQVRASVGRGKRRAAFSRTAREKKNDISLDGHRTALPTTRLLRHGDTSPRSSPMWGRLAMGGCTCADRHRHLHRGCRSLGAPHPPYGRGLRSRWPATILLHCDLALGSRCAVFWLPHYYRLINHQHIYHHRYH